MSIPALVLSMALGSLAAEPGMLACNFPAAEPGTDPISLKVEALPSLSDTDQTFRIRLYLGEAGEFRGLAGPIERTAARDVLIRAPTLDQTWYTIGLRDDGKAALNLLKVDARAASTVRQETREGRCRGYQYYLDTWLTS